MRLTLTFYYLVKNEYKGKKGKRTTLKTTVLYYPMIYYAITIQPILTYTNDANGKST